MYTGVSPSTVMSDMSSSHHNLQVPMNQPNMVQQQQQPFVTQPMENNYSPDHVINDLFFPMDLDTKPTEYNLGNFICFKLLENTPI